MLLRSLIVDDEPMARRRLKRLLLKTGEVTIVGECGDGSSAVAAVQAQTVDVMFLDVQMPRMTGFDVVRAVAAEKPPAIVFVTAFDQFALQAFEAQALDYLLKPFGEDRVRKALARVKTFLHGVTDRRREERTGRMLAAADTVQPGCLLVRDRDRVIVVRPREVDWVEADADYMHLHVGADTYLVRSTLAQMEERLAGDGFVRIHRSRLVNLDRVKELRRLSQGESVVVLKSGGRLNASLGCLKQLQERLGVVL